eukprot:CAMPEP_0198304944 /NCGR_PEP_ID=MMETSP1449-20131203/57651_1 /TAXON_ID=420275 /ORGANISM="Attheya septentrionalis, Strain CCMP2084" /LENGTH=2807 /DNA_ID=CAMNT_0044007473 /DNA_START=500 /DNA_END=8923 /DNA_ORIENTATION=-
MEEYQMKPAAVAAGVAADVDADGPVVKKMEIREEARRRSLELLLDTTSGTDSVLQAVPSLVSLVDCFADSSSKSNGDAPTDLTAVAIAGFEGHSSSSALAESVQRMEAMEVATITNQRSSHSSPSTTTKPNVDQLEVHLVKGLTDIVLQQHEVASDSDEDNGEVKERMARDAHEAILELGRSIPRRVCQHPFKRNDIVWVCRTCQSDETCVLCHDCWDEERHVGHDVAFYHAQAGGCCDCGDPDAWDPQGFCQRHGIVCSTSTSTSNNDQTNEPLSPTLPVDRATGAVTACADWLVHTVVRGVDAAYLRANPPKQPPFSLSHPTNNVTTRPRRPPPPVYNASLDSMDESNPNDNDDDDDSDGYDMTSRHGDTQEVTWSNVSTMTMDASVAAGIIMEAGMSATARPALEEPAQEMEFFPAFASTSKSRSSDTAVSGSTSVLSMYHNMKSLAEQIGVVGREQHGLYLVLHYEDVHTTAHVVAALRDLYHTSSATLSQTQSEAILSKIARLLRNHGDLVVWGPAELMAETGTVAVNCWRDGDQMATRRIGSLMYKKAHLLANRHGLVCSIKTRTELWMEHRAVAVVNWLSVLARSCDPLCLVVSESIAITNKEQKPNLTVDNNNNYLIPLLLADLKLSTTLTSSWHSLLLTLLAIPLFKAALADAYCDSYNQVTAEYARGVGILDRSGYTLSVQFLNRVTYVLDLVRERDLLGRLGKSLKETLTVAAVPSIVPYLDPAVIRTNSSNSHGTNVDIFSFLSASSSEGSTTGTTPGLLSIQSPFRNPSDGNDNNEHHENNVTSGAMERWGVSSSLASSEPAPKTLNPLHPVLTHRRYSACISDLKCVLNVPGMARLFASLPKQTNDDDDDDDDDGDKYNNKNASEEESSCCLNDWISSLSLAQNMDGQQWRSWNRGHIEMEPRGWVGAFNASISLGSLFERLLAWEDEDPSPIKEEDLKRPIVLLSSVDLAYHLLTVGLAKWQTAEMLSHRPTRNTGQLEPHRCCPASLSFSTVAAQHGTALAIPALPVSQVRSWSFHLPLHRFTACCLREVCRRHDNSGAGMDALLARLAIPQYGEEMKRERLFRGLMEFPVLVLSRAAQIRAGLWKRNGPGMQDQVLNYAEPPFCRALRDADLTSVQFAMLGYRALLPPTFQDNQNNLMNSNHDGDGSIADTNTDGVGSAFLVNLLLHRFGVFEFAGFEHAPMSDPDRYLAEQNMGLYPSQLHSDQNSVGEASTTAETDSIVFPWTYTPAKDASSLLSLLEELLHLLIILITELPPPPSVDGQEHAVQAKKCLRREVIHRLASGPKTHSELAEVQHVLPNHYNSVLSEEGKLLNPDDATGAALEAALAEVAARKSVKGKLAPDQWELRRWAWAEYDPAFYHISLRGHQSAAENRPLAGSDQPSGERKKRTEPNPYAPRPAAAHASFERLRRDMTSDASVLAITYRILHVHCRHAKSNKDKTSLRGAPAYEGGAMSETSLARAVHLLTLGAFAWQDDVVVTESWKKHGGSSIGSVFHGRPDSAAPPMASDWIKMAFLGNPHDTMDCDWYEGEENALSLLRRLSDDGGSSIGLIAQDPAIRSGAAWLCDFAIKHNVEAAAILGEKKISKVGEGETDKERRRREAKARAMERMKANADKFAAMMESAEENEEKEESENMSPRLTSSSMAAVGLSHGQGVGGGSIGSTDSNLMEVESTGSGVAPGSITSSVSGDEANVSSKMHMQVSSDRLFRERPRCIICVDAVDDDLQNSSSMDLTNESGASSANEHGSKKRSARKTHGNHALGLCGYVQASTVQKGGGGPLPASYPDYSFQKFVGTHVALCGHAVHSACCESYLATVSARDDRLADRLEGGRRGEFRCPLCQRLSNCLVPFIDIGADWVDLPDNSEQTQNLKVQNAGVEQMSMGTTYDDDENDSQDDVKMSASALQDKVIVSAESDPSRYFPLDKFLATTQWWVSRNNDRLVRWDGRCAFVPVEYFLPNKTLEDDQGSGVENSPKSSTRKLLRRRKSVRGFGKKDVIAAWNAVMRTPRFVRKRSQSFGSSEVPSKDTQVSSTPQRQPHDSSSSGATEVWRKLMDQVSEVSLRADLKRLGEDRLIKDYGEFRHYLVEKSAFNASNRAAGKEIADWPVCISPVALSDSRRQELSREKLISKLFLTIQAFTYSCTSEASEVKRLVAKELISSGGNSSGNISLLKSKFGFRGVSCRGELVLMPLPSPVDDGGAQPFDGRIGRLRFLGLAVMVATGAVSKEIVHLALDFPSGPDSPNESSDMTDEELQTRAPIVFPILSGHVLTHVVAAMCATCGAARARSDSLDLTSAVKIADEAKASDHHRDSNTSEDNPRTDSVMRDCEGFIKLGYIARVLQVLLGCMGMNTGTDRNRAMEEKLFRTMNELLKKDEFNCPQSESWRFSSSNDSIPWYRGCCLLLVCALSDQAHDVDNESDKPGNADNLEETAQMEEGFYRACIYAREAVVAYLAPLGLIMQLLLPGAAAIYGNNQGQAQATPGKMEDFANRHVLDELSTELRIEPLVQMLESSLIREIVKNWYERAHESFQLPLFVQEGVGQAEFLKTSLCCKDGFRLVDWPGGSVAEVMTSHCFNDSVASLTPREGPHNVTSTSSMQIPISASGTKPVAVPLFDTPDMRTPSNEVASLNPPLHSPKKRVPFLGWQLTPQNVGVENEKHRIAMLPTSYTDLYAQLGPIFPDSEQTALCLVCGEVLNAGGKGECTKHAAACGGGAGIFFLLQECVGLIMHVGKAAYVHSPYVDSHGETPQYRGRPLNLDLDRYDILKELWSEHLVREKVVAERGNARQVIIANFY